ncbi:MULTISPECIES: two-component regulator propeller domain-containing protein [unclassified Massilia]|uniref:sensor histidine kinase n=1 Tax=unclassified Massilia TaxID=2609279 RepID=UPI00177B2663|nr:MULTISPECIES: two-component regulator propeller domain-containing protein [unclassified Massilia]MBD8532300.1 GAF domain-containing protein [Massilia sp. CFBP 13647]MBD8673827.1 GAF domain-containing protein [Massilia sp. CFBP 13721]
MLGTILRAGLLLALALAGSAGAAGGDPQQGSQRNLRFERVSVEHGLSQESVLNILQDRQGFMWFGTQAGLNRYDGYKMTVYRTDPQDPGSLPDAFINASFEDAEGRLWFGTKGGLARFDPGSGKFVRYALADAGTPASANRSVNAIAADRKGLLWLGTSDGLKRFDPVSGAFATIRHPGDDGALGGDAVGALAFDSGGALWVGTARGVARLAPGAAQLEHFAPPDADPRRVRINALSVGPNGAGAKDTLWVGTDAGLEAWDLAKGTPQRRALAGQEGVGETRVAALYHDAGGTLWVGTDLDGVKRRDPASGCFVSYRNRPLDPHSLSDNQVSAIRIDRSGTLWVGTRVRGLSRTDLASGGFSNFSFRPDGGYRIGFEKARDVAVRADGKVWIGTTGGGLVLLDPESGATTQLRHQPGRADTIPSDVVHSLSIVGERLYVGSAGALAWSDVRGGPFHPVALPGLGTTVVQDVQRTRDGTLWAVTRAGLYQLDDDLRVRQSWRHDPRNPAGIGDNTLFQMVEDAQGMLWIGTDNGLDRFDRRSGVFTHYRHDPHNPGSLRHNRVYAVTVSRRGQLWVGTAGGLHLLDRDSAGRAAFRLVRLRDAPEPLPIGAVLEDGQGRLWASMTDGIGRYDPASGQYKHYTAKDGLNEGTFYVGSSARGPDGQLHFGGVNGLVSFMPAAIRDNPYPPAVRITDFLVFNKPQRLATAVDRTREITLTQRESVFSFEFAGLHYAAPGSNRYAYQLEGFDKGWVDTDAARRFATYTNLDPGTYVFRVRASNKDGVWSDVPAAVTVTITPPWWKSWWFRLLALALGAALLAAGYRMRIRALTQQKNMLEREVSARTAELMLQKDAAELRKREAEEQEVAADSARRNIALLSDIGRRLTANLDTEAIMATLYEHVQVLMEAPVFAVAVARPDGALFDFAYAVVDGRRCPSAQGDRRIGEVEQRQLAAWCIEHGREVFINELAQDAARYLPGVDPQEVAAYALPCARDAGSAHPLPQSFLYVPVAVGQRVLGALGVQSFAPRAYQRVHLDMLRTLAAYVAVALDNAQAYRQLKDVQGQLAAQEKLASLGSLVAGVAHELNTPIGNSLLMASTLHEKTLHIMQALDSAALRRAELEGYMEAAGEASQLIVRSLHQAADLVNSFRQVSVDQASAQRRRFDLAQACQEILATLMNKVRLAGHTLTLAVPGGIIMDSYPGPLGQVLINFVNNALLHAFDGPGGSMRLSAEPIDQHWVRIVFADDGRGIAREHLPRVFDPFFTTRMGQGGTGLGLNIAHTIATSLMKGAIRVEGAPGGGTVFILELPLRVAEARAPAPAAA